MDRQKMAEGLKFAKLTERPDWAALEFEKGLTEHREREALKAEGLRLQTEHLRRRHAARTLPAVESESVN
jgi:hypothetical protein